MEKYIPKDALLEELESWRDGIKKGIFSIPLTGSDRTYATFEYEILGKIKDFLDTFEVKEVDFKLTLEDIEIILGIENNILHECNDNGQLVIEAYPKGEDYYGEILRRFNNQRIKPQRMISAEAKEAMYNKPADEYDSLTDFGKQMKK